MCELLDAGIFAGCERFEPDMEGMQELWQHELDSNEREAESVVGILARYILSHFFFATAQHIVGSILEL